MTIMFRVTDDNHRVVGVFDSLDEARAIVPEVSRWRAVEDGAEGDLDGWRPDGSFWDGPHFSIRQVGV